MLSAHYRQPTAHYPIWISKEKGQHVKRQQLNRTREEKEAEWKNREKMFST